MSSRSSVSWHPMIVFCCFWPGCTQPCLQAEWSSSRSIAACYLMEAECVSNIITSSWTLRNGCVACATVAVTKRTKKAGYSTRQEVLASNQNQASSSASWTLFTLSTRDQSVSRSYREKSVEQKSDTAKQEMFFNFIWANFHGRIPAGVPADCSKGVAFIKVEADSTRNEYIK